MPETVAENGWQKKGTRAAMTERLPHGGNLTKAEAEYGRPLNGWLDLSTGINPMPYPVGRIDPKFWHRLPDQADLHVLLLAARQAYGIAGQAGVVAAPGTQAIIQ
ncbi:MAG TPA: hypothetical protein ENI69_07595, partial [Rhodospirillales bacterium]|nr:hypothetical protein [Rhodospirillales bacterium]